MARYYPRINSIKYLCNDKPCPVTVLTQTIFLFRKVQRHQQHRVPNSEAPAVSAFIHIVPIREADRHSDKRRSSLSKVPSSARFYRNPSSLEPSVCHVRSPIWRKPKRRRIIAVIVLIILVVVVIVIVATSASSSSWRFPLIMR